MSGRRIYATTPNPRAALNELYGERPESRASSPPPASDARESTPRAPAVRPRANSEPASPANLLNRKS